MESKGGDRMNHDYVHCGDYSKEICQKECFRVQLTEDLKTRTDLLGLPFTWMRFVETKDCPLKNMLE